MNEVQHFGSAIYVWDVVNEPLDPNQSDCLSHGPFYQVLGASYMEIALRAARQFAPPGTQLYINDFSTTDSNRLKCLIKVVARLRARGFRSMASGTRCTTTSTIRHPSRCSRQSSCCTICSRTCTSRSPRWMSACIWPATTPPTMAPMAARYPNPSLRSRAGCTRSISKYSAALKGKLDAVTFWGMGDDNTWLGNFPIHRLDLPLPFDTRLQAKPAYWGIVDPTELPGFGLSFAVVSRTGPLNARVWTIKATNPSSASAVATQINGFSLFQVSGRRCRPEVTAPPSFPVPMGDVAPTSTASAALTIDFSGCSREADFTLVMPWSSAKYETGTLVLKHQHP